VCPYRVHEAVDICPHFRIDRLSLLKRVVILHGCRLSENHDREETSNMTIQCNALWHPETRWKDAFALKDLGE
jgi:hypothetical protein